MARNSKIGFYLPLIAFGVIIIIGAIGLIGAIGGQNDSKAPASILSGKPAPALPPQALHDDLSAQLADFEGKPVLVNFMASWCAPCRAEIPALASLGDEVAIIAVAYKDKPEDTAAFLEQYGNPYDSVLMDYDGQYALGWGIYGVPETFILKPDHTILLRHAGPIFKDVITDIIRPALSDLK